MSDTRFKNKSMKILNYVLNTLIGIFSFILFMILLLNFQTVFLGEKYNSFFGFSFFEVETGSMEPTIEIGDWIITKAEKSYELKDIVTFEEDKNFVTHRIVQECQGTYVTKGDSNNTIDESITKEDIVGKVVLIIPRVGFIKKVLLNPKFIIGFIVLLILLCTIIDDNKKSKIINIFKKKDKEDLDIKDDKIEEKKEEIKEEKQEIKVEKEDDSDKELEIPDKFFSTMKVLDEEDSKTGVLSTIDLDLGVPELSKKEKEEEKQEKEETNKEEIL